MGMQRESTSSCLDPSEFLLGDSLFACIVETEVTNRAPLSFTLESKETQIVYTVI